MQQEDKLIKFVRRVVAPGAKYTTLTLVQVLATGGQNTLRSMQISDMIIGDDKVAEIVAEMCSTAQENADGLRGPTSYRLKALRGVTIGENSPIFRLRPQESEFSDEEALGDSEGSKEQMLAQAWRHIEVQGRLLAQVFEVQARATIDRENRLMSRIEHLEDKAFDVIAQAEELASEKDSRDIARAQLLANEKRKDQVIGLLKPLVPVAIAKFKGTPESAKPGLHLETLKAILSDIKPEEMEQIANILGIKSLALAELYMEAHKEDDTPDDQSTSPAEPKH